MSYGEIGTKLDLKLKILHKTVFRPVGSEPKKIESNFQKHPTHKFYVEFLTSKV